jgi:hypothetical protein
MNRKEKETIDFLESKKIELKQKYQQDIDSLDNTIQLLKSGGVADVQTKQKEVPKTTSPSVKKSTKKGKTSKTRKRKTQESVPTQITKILTHANRFMLGSEILEVIQGSKNLTGDELDKLRKYINSSLSILKKEGSVVAVKDVESPRQKLYGLSDWLNEQGEIVIEGVE